MGQEKGTGMDLSNASGQHWEEAQALKGGPCTYIGDGWQQGDPSSNQMPFLAATAAHFQWIWSHILGPLLHYVPHINKALWLVRCQGKR